MKNKKITLLLAACISASFSLSAKSLTDLQSMQYNSSAGGFIGSIEGKDDIRKQALRDAALAAGAQWGYRHQIELLKSEIMEQQDSLDSLFDFNTLMKLTSDGYNELYLLPPVILETNDAISLSVDARTLRLSGKVWEILKPEKLVTSAPNWRQYLIFDRGVAIPNTPNILLPKSPFEEKLWKDTVFIGWNSGVNQAEREMERRI